MKKINMEIDVLLKKWKMLESYVQKSLFYYDPDKEENIKYLEDDIDTLYKKSKKYHNKYMNSNYKKIKKAFIDWRKKEITFKELFVTLEIQIFNIQVNLHNKKAIYNLTEQEITEKNIFFSIAEKMDNALARHIE